MLSQQRHEIILKLLKEKGSITATELKDILETSESTIYRDITALDKEGRLKKVFGGAVENDSRFVTAEYTVLQKKELNMEEKKKIAAYAAALIEPDDFVYVDAGTTTACLADYIKPTTAVFVTNAVAHAKSLAALGLRVFLIGGELKASTEAIIGSDALSNLHKFHFTKGFFGTNGVTKKAGCTTPDPAEASMKQTAMELCRKKYVLCDHTKFGNISAVTFSPYSAPTYITDRKIKGFEAEKNITVAE